jgi:hypothetical protein
MKTKTSFPSLITILFACSILSIQGLKAQDSTFQDQSPIGSYLKLEDVVSKADVVFVGVLLQTGPVTVAAPGQVRISGNQVKVLQTLKGSVNEQVSVEFNVHNDSKGAVKIGNTYIFFVKSIAHPDPDPYLAIKILAAADDKISKVKALIAAAPASK